MQDILQIVLDMKKNKWDTTMLNRYTGSILGALGAGGISALGTLLIAAQPTKERLIKNTILGALIGGAGGFTYGYIKEPFKVKNPGIHRIWESALSPVAKMSDEELKSIKKYTVGGISVAAPSLAVYGGYHGYKHGGWKGAAVNGLLGLITGTAAGTAFGTTVGTAMAPPSK